MFTKFVDTEGIIWVDGYDTFVLFNFHQNQLIDFHCCFSCNKIKVKVQWSIQLVFFYHLVNE